jgi:CheY-like chemotaxis protein/HD-like signal output (HDOD) protein
MKSDHEEPAKVSAAVLQRCTSAAALRIVQIVKNDRAPMHSLESAIAANPVFTAHLLTLINYAPGLPQQLLSLSQAISVLGVDQMKSLALGLSAFNLTSQRDANQETPEIAQQIGLRELWEHALGVAVVAARIAAKHFQISPLQLFTAGFIHDIGRILLFRHAPEAFADMVTWPREKAPTTQDAERIAFGVDHLTVGAEWCQRLEIAFPLQETLRLHHQRLDSLETTTSDETRKMIAILQSAEYLCAQHGIGKSFEPYLNSSSSWTALGLRVEDWNEPCSTIKAEIESSRELFGLPRENHRWSRVGRKPKTSAVSKARGPDAKVASNGSRGQVLPFPFPADLPKAEQEKNGFGKLVLLVVEDHGSLCDMVSLFLMRHGYHVRTANNGESALEILSREDIHLVLLDLMLPKVDGFEVLRQLHRTQQDRFPYIIVVSAGASEKDRQKVLDLGANEYMAKPFHLNRLLERVQAVEKFLY